MHGVGRSLGVSIQSIAKYKTLFEGKDLIAINRTQSN